MIRAILGALCGVAAILALLLVIDVPAAVAVLGDIAGGDLVLVVPVIVLTTLCKTLRWRMGFPAPVPSLKEAWAALCLGNGLNCLLPLRSGDLLRVVLLPGRHERTVALATVVAEKLVDAAFVINCLALALLLVPLPAHWRGALAVLAPLSLLTTLILIGAPWARLLPARIRGCDLQPFFAALGVLRQRRVLLGYLLGTVLIWSGEATVVYLVARGIAALAPTAALVAVCALGVGMLLPALPAQVGTYHAAGTAVLVALGLEAERALATTIALHGVNLLATLALAGSGFLFLTPRQLDRKLALLSEDPGRTEG